MQRLWLWWLLQWLGHPWAAVLNGGIDAWRSQGFALDTNQPKSTPAVFNGKPDDTMWVDVDDVSAALAQELPRGLAAGPVPAV